jgi:hypothetical protein
MRVERDEVAALLDERDEAEVLVANANCIRARMTRAAAT